MRRKDGFIAPNASENREDKRQNYRDLVMDR